MIGNQLSIRETAEPENILYSLQTSFFSNAAFNPNGEQFVTIDRHSIWIWKPDLSHQVIFLDNNLMGLHLSPHGFVTFSDFNSENESDQNKLPQLDIWSFANNQVMKVHTVTAKDLSLKSPSKTHRTVYYTNNKLHIWDLIENRKILVINDVDETSVVRLSSEGRYLAVTTTNKVQIWNLDTLDLSNQIAMYPVVTDFQFSQDAKLLLNVSFG
jgi:uncharacterized protein with WD repeat